MNECLNRTGPFEGCLFSVLDAYEGDRPPGSPSLRHNGRRDRALIVIVYALDRASVTGDCLGTATMTRACTLRAEQQYGRFTTLLRRPAGGVLLPILGVSVPKRNDGWRRSV